MLKRLIGLFWHDGGHDKDLPEPPSIDTDKDSGSPRSRQERALRRDINRWFMKSGCPCCRTAECLKEGPSAGVSTNVRCKECGARYNFSAIFDSVKIDWIEGPLKDFPVTVPEARVAAVKGILGRNVPFWLKSE